MRWHTGTEGDILGFRVYRSRGHSWRRITHSLIRAKASVAGASYRFLDKTATRGAAYSYRIEAINRDGTSSWFGQRAWRRSLAAVRADGAVPAPTAVPVDQLEPVSLLYLAAFTHPTPAAPAE